MLDQRDLRAGWVFRLTEATLRALACVAQRLQVAGGPEGRGAEADLDPCLVHHAEHVREAVVRLADEVTDGTGLAGRSELCLRRS